MFDKIFNRWQRRAINYFISVMRSWSPEERQAVFEELYREFTYAANEAWRAPHDAGSARG